MLTRKNFVEPEIVKYEQPLDKVTLHGACSGGGEGSSGGEGGDGGS